jgi:hypothetical protein
MEWSPIVGTFVQKCKFDLGPPGYFITSGDFIYDSDHITQAISYADDEGLMVIKSGFKTDFASIPNITPRWLFDPMRHARLAALPHDFGCRMAQSYDERVTADHVFYEAMGDEGVKQWRRVIMFSAVRANTFRMKIMGAWK